jgi:hypothetical protein
MSRCSICECKTMNCVCDPYDKGYAEGIADEHKRLLGDGSIEWRAWSPQGELAQAVAQSRQGIEWWVFNHDPVIDVQGLRFQLDPDSVSAKNLVHKKVVGRGWQIKPVKLVVLDETGGK